MMDSGTVETRRGDIPPPVSCDPVGGGGRDGNETSLSSEHDVSVHLNECHALACASKSTLRVHRGARAAMACC